MTRKLDQCQLWKEQTQTATDPFDGLTRRFTTRPSQSPVLQPSDCEVWARIVLPYIILCMIISLAISCLDQIDKSDC